MTQPVQPVQRPVAVGKPAWVAALLSIIETVAFVVAVILAIWFNKSDAIISALIAASAHAFNHNAGGSPV